MVKLNKKNINRFFDIFIIGVKNERNFINEKRYIINNRYIKER